LVLVQPVEQLVSIDDLAEVYATVLWPFGEMAARID